MTKKEEDEHLERHQKEMRRHSIAMLKVHGHPELAKKMSNGKARAARKVAKALS